MVLKAVLQCLRGCDTDTLEGGPPLGLPLRHGLKAPAGRGWGGGGGEVWRGGLPGHTLPPPSVAPHWQDMESAGPSLHCQATSRQWLLSPPPLLTYQERPLAREPCHYHAGELGWTLLQLSFQTGPQSQGQRDPALPLLPEPAPPHPPTSSLQMRPDPAGPGPGHSSWTCSSPGHQAVTTDSFLL